MAQIAYDLVTIGGGLGGAPATPMPREHDRYYGALHTAEDWLTAFLTIVAKRPTHGEQGRCR